MPTELNEIIHNPLILIEDENCVGIPYIIAKTNSKSSGWGKDVVRNSYITLSGGVNKSRFLNGNNLLDLSGSTGVTTAKIEGSPTTIYINFLSLTELFVSKSTAIERLICSGNQLKSLDVTKNTPLTFLVCYENQLTIIDTTKNINLTYLRCDQNQLTSLDTTKNTALTYLNCGTNQLTSLDVTKNVNLQVLNCYTNQFVTLDLSKNNLLVRLNCNNNPNLTTIYVNQTQLNKLNANQLTGWQKPATANYVLKP